VDQDQFLTILSREDALARFRCRVVSARGPSEPRALADALGCALAERCGGPIDVPPFDRSMSTACRFVCRSGAGQRATPVRVMLNDEVIACGNRADATGAVGHRTSMRRAVRCARRRRHRHGRAYPTRGLRAIEIAAPLRRDNSYPMPAPTLRVARRCRAPAIMIGSRRSACSRPAGSRRFPSRAGRARRGHLTATNCSARSVVASAEIYDTTARSSQRRSARTAAS